MTEDINLNAMQMINYLILKLFHLIISIKLQINTFPQNETNHLNT